MHYDEIASSLRAALTNMPPNLANHVSTRLIPFVDQFNHDEVSTETKAKELLSILEYIDFHTTPDELASSEEYHQIKSALEDSCRTTLLAQERLESSSPSIEQIISIMSQQKLDLFVTMLLQQEREGTNKLASLYSSDDDSIEATLFREFISHNQITYIGGGNSKNFKITSLSPETPEKVLKIDSRLNKSRKADVELHQTVPEHLLPTYVARQVRAQEPKTSEAISRTFLVTDFCPNGSLLNYRARQAENKLILENVDGLFITMADILLALEKEQFIFPDAKITNWLVDDEGVLKIADTKSFEKTDQEGLIDDPDDKLLKSPGFLLPEFMNLSISAPKVHANLLGLNLYFYLTGSPLKLNLFSTPSIPGNSFDNPVFKGKFGREYKNLIEGLINNTVTLADAKQKLADMRIKKQQDFIATPVAPTKSEKQPLITSRSNDIEDDENDEVQRKGHIGVPVVDPNEWGDSDDDEDNAREKIPITAKVVNADQCDDNEDEAEEETINAKLVDADEWGDDEDESEEETITAKVVDATQSDDDEDESEETIAAMVVDANEWGADDDDEEVEELEAVKVHDQIQSTIDHFNEIKRASHQQRIELVEESKEDEESDGENTDHLLRK